MAEPTFLKGTVEVLLIITAVLLPVVAFLLHLGPLPGAWR